MNNSTKKSTFGWGSKIVAVVVIMTLLVNSFLVYATHTDDIVSAQAASAELQQTITSANWNLGFEGSTGWTMSNGATRRAKSSGEYLAINGTINWSTSSHKVFDTENGSYVLQQRPSDNGYNAVTTTQTFTGLVPNAAYRVGFFAKSIGVGQSYLLVGAPNETAASANERSIYHINSNLGVLGNGITEGSFNRAVNTQGWHYGTAIGTTDGMGSLALTFCSTADRTVDAANITKYGNNYTLFVDNLDVRPYAELTGYETVTLNAKIYDFSFREKGYQGFFEFAWSGGPTEGQHSEVVQGLLKGVLENGKPVFTDSVSMFNNANTYNYKVANDNDYTRVTPDLLNNQLALFRNDAEAIDYDIVLYRENGSDGAYVFDSSMGIDNQDCATGDSGGFFPLCDSTCDAEGLKHNFHFGMEVKSPFLVDDSKNQAFTFTGDDDFWLFIDDVLVLDLGNLHQVRTGTLDINTSKVTVQTGSSTYKTDTIYNIVKANLQSAYGTGDSRVTTKLNEMFGANANANSKLLYGYHDFSIYYMERCTEASNLKLVASIGLPDIKSFKSGVKLDRDGNPTDSKLVDVGDTISYTLDVTNSGAPNLQAITINDPLPASLSYVNGSLTVQELVDGAWVDMSRSAYDISASSSSISGQFNSKALTKGAQVRIAYRAIVTEQVKTDISFRNIAYVSNNPASSELFSYPPLTIDKSITSVSDGYKPGEVIQYSVTLTNKADDELTDILITDSLGVQWPNSLPSGFAWGVSDGATVSYSNSYNQNTAGAQLYLKRLAKGSATVTYNYIVTEADYLNGLSGDTSTLPNTVVAECSYMNDTITVSDTEQANLLPPDTGLSLAKEVSLSENSGFGERVTTLPGSVVYYRIRVTNESEVALNNIEVTDYQVGSLNNTIPALAAGESTTITGSYQIPADFDPAQTFVNTATARTSYAGKELVASDTASVDLMGVEITKTANVATAEDGDRVTFTIVVKNTGAVAITNAVVTDSLTNVARGNLLSAATGNCTISNGVATIRTLAVGAQETLTFTYKITSDDAISGHLSNTATVAASTPSGAGFSDSDSADIPLVQPTPGIDIQKQVSVYEVNGFGENAAVVPGSTVWYKITVTNTGNVDLTNVVVTDPLIPSLNYTIGSLAKNASADVRVSSFIAAPADCSTQMINTAKVTALYNGESLSDEDSASVDFYKLAITKTARQESGAYNDTIDFDIVVTNTGSTTVYDSVVSDSLTSLADGYTLVSTDGKATVGANGKAIIPELARGESAAFTFSTRVSVAQAKSGRLVNTATVTATNPHDVTNPITASASAEVPLTVPSPSLTISKLVATERDGEYKDNVTVQPGATVWYKLVVANTGNVELTNIVVTDDKVSALNHTIASLALGAQSDAFVGSYKLPSAGVNTSFVNTAEALALFDGAAVTAYDSATVDFIKITIDKTAVSANGAVGQYAEFSVVVKNEGSVALTNIAVADSLTDLASNSVLSSSSANVVVDGEGRAVISSLASGASESLTFRYLVTEEDVLSESITNTATATVSNPNDPNAPITVRDDAELPLEASTTDIRILKEVSLTEKGAYSDCVNAKPGDTVWFRVRVINDSQVSLRNIRITDALVPALDTTVASLAAGAQSDWYTASYTIPENSDPSKPVVNEAVARVTYNGRVLPEANAFAKVNLYAIDVEKTANADSARVGETVTYAVTVTNTGSAAMTDISVSDPKAGVFSSDSANVTASGNTAVIASLAPNAQETLTFTYVISEQDVLASSLKNTATAEFTDPADDKPVSDSDDELLPLETPKTGLSVEKQVALTKDGEYGDTVAVKPGDTVWFRVRVTNESEVALSDIALTDKLVPALDSVYDLGAGKTSSWKYASCTVSETADPTQAIVNTVKANADYNGSALPEASASAKIVLYALDVTKTADVASAKVNDTVSFTINVKNAGSAAMSNIVVGDSLTDVAAGYVLSATTANCTVGENGVATIAHLAVGQSERLVFTCRISEADVLGSFISNIATGTFTDPADGEPVTDEAEAELPLIAPNTGVSVEKQISRSREDGYTSMISAKPGDTVWFRVRVTNNSDVALSDIAVTDELVAALNGTYSLGAGAYSEWAYASYTIPADYDAGKILTNVVKANAVYNGSALPEATAAAKADLYALDISKSINATSAKVGDTAEFTIVVKNTGSAAMENIRVTDSRTAVENGFVLIGTSANCTVGEDGVAVIRALAAGESETLAFRVVISENDVLSSSYINRATAEYTDPVDSATITDTDTAELPLVTPNTELAIDKQVSRTKNGDYGKLVDVEPGDTVWFRVQVTNNSDVSLENIAVTDALVADLTYNIPRLASGAASDWVYAEYTVPEDYDASKQLVNIVAANVTYNGNALPEVKATAAVNVYALDILKTADQLSAEVNDVVTFTILVRNAGTADMTNIIVTDTLTDAAKGNLLSGTGTNVAVADGVATIASLPAGGSETLTFTYTISEDDVLSSTLTNTAQARFGEIYVRSDAVLPLNAPNTSVSIAKQVSLTENGVYASSVNAKPGDTVWFRVRVTNDSDVALSDIKVTDTLVPGLNHTIATLAAGADSDWKTASYTIPADSDPSAAVVNEAAANVEYNGSALPEAKATAKANLYALSIVKEAPLKAAAVGETVAFDVTVTNTGSAPMSNVVVTDSLTDVARGCKLVAASANATVDANGVVTIAGLAVGASERLTFNYIVSEDDVLEPSITNTAKAVFTDPADNKPVSDTDNATLQLTAPTVGVDVIKQVSLTEDGVYGDSVDAKPGDTVWFRVAVRNRSQVALKNVSVTDELVPAIDTTIRSIAANTTSDWLYASYTIPASSDPAQPIVNEVRVNASYNGSDLPEAIDDATVNLYALDVEKTGQDAPAAVNNTVRFTIKVTNTGAADMADVRVTDSRTDIAAGNVLSADGNSNITVDEQGTATIASLPVGGSETLIFTYRVSEDDVLLSSLTNYATARFTDPADGVEVADTDDAPLALTAPKTELQLEKQVSLTENGEYASVTAAKPGDTVWFRVRVTNNSDVRLTDVVVTDELVPELDHTVATLASGETSDWVYASYTIPASADASKAVTNIAAANVIYNGVQQPEAKAQAVVELYALDITKQADQASADVNDEVTFTVRVTNTGSAQMTDVEVTDSLTNIAKGFVLASASDNVTVTAGKAAIKTLAPGDSEVFTFNYKISENDVLLSSITNTATAVFGDISDEASAELPLNAPNTSLAIEKEVALAQDGTYADTVAAKPGDTVWFRVRVTNLSDVALKDIAVSDALVPAINSSVDLAAGESSDWITGSYTIPADVDASQKIVNTAAANATYNGDAVPEVKANASVEIYALEISKTAPIDSVAVNKAAQFTILVRNSGSATMTNVVVTDDLTDAAAGDLLSSESDNVTIENGVATIKTLGAGDSENLVFSYTVTEEDVLSSSLTNNATVEFTDPADDGKVTDTDDAELLLTVPKTEITVTKQVSLTRSGEYGETVAAKPGDTVWFRVRVANNSDVKLTDIAVTDELVPELDHTVATLASGKSSDWKYESYTIPADVDPAQPVVNIVKANATYNGTQLPEAKDAAEVELYDIDIKKTAAVESAKVGETVSFTIKVTNIGSADVINAVVKDSMTDPAMGYKLAAASEGVTVDADGVATIASLIPGETATLTFNYKLTIADMSKESVVNIATVTAENPANPDNPIEAEDEAPITTDGGAYDPLIITKSVDKSVVMPGETVQFAITVTNTGKADYQNLYVQDPFLGRSWQIASLEAGKSYTVKAEDITYEVAERAAPGERTNIAYLDNDAVFDADDENSYIAKDDAKFTVKNDPGISITKTAPAELANRGSKLVYPILVRNTGNCTLYNVRVTESLDGIWTCSDTRAMVDETNALVLASIEPFESIDMTYAHVVPASATLEAGYDNVATVTAPHPDEGGTPLTDDDTATVLITASPAPELYVTKTVDVEEAMVGDEVTFTISIFNSGKAALTDIKIEDVFTRTGFTDPIALSNNWRNTLESVVTIQPGDTWVSPALTYTVPGNAKDGETFLNTVTVTAYNPNAEDVTDPAQRLSDGASAQFNVKKDFKLNVAKSVSMSEVLPDQEVNYTIVVNNPGNATLYNVQVTDPLLEEAGVGTWPVVIPELAPDASKTLIYTYTIPYTAVKGDQITNKVDVFARNPDHPGEGDLSASADVTVDVVGDLPQQLFLTKAVNKTYGDPGDTVVFTINATNTSKRTYRDVLIYDPMLGELIEHKEAFKAGEVWTISGASTAWQIPADAVGGEVYTNTAYIFEKKSFDENNPDLAKALDTAEASVTVNRLPSINVAKIATAKAAEASDKVVYTVAVTNDGNVDLVNVVLNDVLHGNWGFESANISNGVDNTLVIASLPIGAVENVSFTYFVPDDALSGERIDNTITAVGEDPRNPNFKVSDDDEADVPVIMQGLEVSKTADRETAMPGDEVTYVITVTNIGDTTLTDVKLTDMLPIVYENTSYPAGKVITTIESMEPGAVETFEVIYSVPADEPIGSKVVNTAVAKASNGITDSDSDDIEVVKIPVNAFEITKKANVENARPGDTINYTIIVTNTGNTDLTNIAVTDSLAVRYGGRDFRAGDTIATIAALAAGKSETLFATYVVPANFAAGTTLTNTATAKPAETDAQSAKSDVQIKQIDKPDFTVIKSANVANTKVGSTVYYTITVTNTGNVELKNLRVSDELLGYSTTIPSLAVGQVWVSTPNSLSHTIPNNVANGSTLYNRASVLGDSVQANDDASVDVTNDTTIVKGAQDEYTTGVTNNFRVLGDTDNLVSPNTGDTSSGSTFFACVLVSTSALILLTSKKKTIRK